MKPTKQMIETAAKDAKNQSKPKPQRPQDVRLDDLDITPTGHIVVAEEPETAKPGKPDKDDDFDYVPTKKSEAPVDVDKLEENAEKIAAGVERAAVDLFEAQQRIESARATGNGRKLQFAEEQEADVLANAKKHIDKQLNRSGAYLTAAATAFLTATLAMPYVTADEIKAMLKMLANRGLLVPLQSWQPGAIRIGYEQYKLGDYGFMSSDIAAITNKANSLSIKSDKLEAKKRNAHVAAMGSGDISLSDAISGLNGTVVITVPTEYVLVGLEGAKKERRRGGGTLELAFSDNHVVPVDGEGAFKPKVSDMVQGQTRITRDFLKLSEEAMATKKNRIIEAVQAAEHINYPQAREMVENRITLWWMIHRTIWTMEEEVARAEEFKVMQNMAKIEPVAFFGLNGHTEEQVLDQPCLLRLEGFVREKRLINPFILAQWEEEDEGHKVFRVLDVPSNLRETFGEFIDKPMTEANLRPGKSQLAWLIDKVSRQTAMAASLAGADDED